MRSGFIILLHGPMGSGKTTVSKLLHEKCLPAARVALPDIRRLISGDHHKTADTARLVMYEMTSVYCDQKIPVIVEVVCNEDTIKKYKILASKNNISFLAFRLNADPEVRWKRVCNRTAEMMNVNELSKEKLAELKDYFDTNNTFYTKQKGVVGVEFDTSTISAQKVCDFIFDEICNQTK